MVLARGEGMVPRVVFPPKVRYTMDNPKAPPCSDTSPFGQNRIFQKIYKHLK